MTEPKPLIHQLLTRRNPAVDTLADSMRDGHHLHRVVSNILLYLDEQAGPDGSHAWCAICGATDEAPYPRRNWTSDNVFRACCDGCWVALTAAAQAKRPGALGEQSHAGPCLSKTCQKFGESGGCAEDCPSRSEEPLASETELRQQAYEAGYGVKPRPALSEPLVPVLEAWQPQTAKHWAETTEYNCTVRLPFTDPLYAYREVKRWRDMQAATYEDGSALLERFQAQQVELDGSRSALARVDERLRELEQRLARVAELAHDRDGDTHELRSKRLGQCASIAWDHMEESFSDDPLKKRSTLKWAHLAKQLSQAEDDRLQLSQKLEEAMAHGRVLSETSGPVISSLKRQRDELARKLDSVVCSHTETVRGKDIPRRYGSYRSEVCVTCGRFRALTHHNDEVAINGHWRPASEYDAAVASSEDE